jgi:hypothetical protein
MSFSDETLMAYADGELHVLQRAAVERAMRDDPELAARVAQYRELRSDVFAAFAPIVEEAVPARLEAAAAPAKVADLDAAREARSLAAVAQAPRRWSWAEWGGMAAALAVGVLAGSLRLQDGGGVAGDGAGKPALAVAANADGALLAQGPLADALSQQLAGDAPGQGKVAIGLSFVSRDGALCRSFTMGASAGLACRDGGRWTLPVLAAAGQDADPGASGEYRQAGSAMPPAVLDAIDARISGATLDAQAEQAARQRGWQR